jgi:hypothetical protein
LASTALTSVEPQFIRGMSGYSISAATFHTMKNPASPSLSRIDFE